MDRTTPEDHHLLAGDSGQARSPAPQALLGSTELPTRPPPPSSGHLPTRALSPATHHLPTGSNHRCSGRHATTPTNRAALGHRHPAPRSSSHAWSRRQADWVPPYLGLQEHVQTPAPQGPRTLPFRVGRGPSCPSSCPKGSFGSRASTSPGQESTARPLMRVTARP